MEDFIPFELAIKLKENGFKQGFNIFGHKLVFSNENTIKHISDIGAYEKEYFGINIPCPSISQVLKRLRDTHKLFISPCVIADYQDDFHRDITYWSFIVVNIESGDSIYREYERVTEKRYDTYEDAAIAGIEYAIDNLI